MVQLFQLLFQQQELMPPFGAAAAANSQFATGSTITDGLVATKMCSLRCRVQQVANSSQGFECPCHGSKYNMVGEYFAGPAQNLDRFNVANVNGRLLSTLVQLLNHLEHLVCL